uniref:UvrD-like helicase ATP-binding domain-containing protein n=1 Tax=viral metagenome TaxID=1070528 RepID=A0A6C0EGY7_9ZZZZ
MPKFALYNNKITYPSDLYKQNINVESSFTCYNCDESLLLRQSRGKTENYVEHFYHPNPCRNGTHIECENIHIDKIRKMGDWHSMFSNSLLKEACEIFRSSKKSKHFVDGYDEKNDLGIEFQNSPIQPEDVANREKTTPIDWIFNVEKQYKKYVNVGKYIAIEIPFKCWQESVKECNNNVFLYTGNKEWCWLTDRNSYFLEMEGVRKHVWIIFKDDIVGYQDVFENTCLESILSENGKTKLEELFNQQENMEKIEIAYARCRESMYLLDNLHRHHIQVYKFPKNSITAIKSVAGSGKTTTLLELAKIHKKKRILYLAFNKNLITEIQDKLKTQKITNMYPRTFDSLMRSIYIEQKGNPQQIDDLRPNTLHLKINWFQGKNWRIKKQCIDYLTKFCRQVEFTDIEEYCKDRFGKPMPLLKMVWEKVVNSYIVTFDTIRKLVHNHHWAREYIRRNYDMIFIDEAQDFDDLMLDVLLKDTDVPKLFVGDAMQAIYQWRGSINAFDKLPEHSLFMEFYSTFRVGNPACDRIRSMFDKCWMISKSDTPTYFDKHFDKSEPYVYLFRSWRFLLLEAQEEQNIYIYGYNEKERMIISLHERLMKYSLSDEEKQDMEDDLPNFLLSYTAHQLRELLQKVKSNIVPKEKAKCIMYTIHSFKGCEHNNVKLCEDIKEEEANLLYVALTRGKKKISYFHD